jgi:hypothetical protein
MQWNTSDRSALAALGTGDGIDIPRDPISLRALQNWDICHRILILSGKSKADKIAQWMNSL